MLQVEKGVCMGTRRVLSRPVSENHCLLEGPLEKQESNVLNFPFRGGEPDSTMHVDCNMSSMDIFSRFFTNDVWGLLVTETNQYAARIREQSSHMARCYH